MQTKKKKPAAPAKPIDYRLPKNLKKLPKCEPDQEDIEAMRMADAYFAAGGKGYLLEDLMAMDPGASL